MNKLQVGDRIKVINGYNTNNSRSKIKRGITGTIIDFANIEKTLVAIEFDEFINGHSCLGKTKPGHGWIITIDKVVKLEDDVKPDENLSLKASL